MSLRIVTKLEQLPGTAYKRVRATVRYLSIGFDWKPDLNLLENHRAAAIEMAILCGMDGRDAQRCVPQLRRDEVGSEQGSASEQLVLTWLVGRAAIWDKQESEVSKP